MTSLYKLVMRSGPEAEKVYKLEKEEFTIGRELINDLIINDPEISRKHARLIKKDEQYFLEDLNSTNGTFLSGKKVTKPTPLKNGNTIELGRSIVLEVVVEELGGIPEVQEEKSSEKQEGTKEIKEASRKAKSEKVASIKKTEIEAGQAFEEKQTPSEEAEARKTPTWLIILIIVLLFLLVFCVLPLFIIEWTNQWCNLFGPFFNQIQPGVCPYL